jgi:alpha-L-arabinofuranosidase
VNRNMDEDIHFEADMRSFEHYRVKEYLVLESDDIKKTNGYQRGNVYPVKKENYQFEDGRFETSMQRCSWNVIRFSGNDGI